MLFSLTLQLLVPASMHIHNSFQVLLATRLIVPTGILNFSAGSANQINGFSLYGFYFVDPKALMNKTFRLSYVLFALVETFSTAFVD